MRIARTTCRSNCKGVLFINGSIAIVFTSVDTFSAKSLVRAERSAFWNHPGDFFESLVKLFSSQLT